MMYLAILNILFFNIILPTLDTFSDLSLVIDLYRGVPQCTPEEDVDPCNPSPCGSNTLCQVLDGGPVCECMNDYIGNPLLACKPECVLNTECPTTQACINQKCLDPCPGTCGINAECRVAIHRAVCTCIRDYEGDPFRQCYPKSKF